MMLTKLVEVNPVWEISFDVFPAVSSKTAFLIIGFADVFFTFGVGGIIDGVGYVVVDLVEEIP